MSNGIKYIYGVASASQNSSVELCYRITWLDEEIQRLVRTILGSSLLTVMDFPSLKFDIRPKGRKKCWSVDTLSTRTFNSEVKLGRGGMISQRVGLDFFLLLSWKISASTVIILYSKRNKKNYSSFVDRVYEETCVFLAAEASDDMRICLKTLFCFSRYLVSCIFRRHINIYVLVHIF